MDFYERAQAARRRTEAARLQERIAINAGDEVRARLLGIRRREYEEAERQEQRRCEHVRAYRAHMRELGRQLEAEAARLGPDVPRPLPPWW
ncbi:hypothetical protein [Streptomyces luteireticuli]|uniref:Uncharacterized protein n=1 Tax=Streptomyces luteireticuli TaxID=173858 RepID=A0ABN0Y6E5_9ACTN